MVVVVVVVGATVVVVEVVAAGGAVVVAGAAVAVVEAPAEAAAEEAVTSGIALGADWPDAAGPDSEGRGAADEALGDEATAEAVGAAETLASVSAEPLLSPDEQAAATKTKQTNPQTSRRFSFNNLFIPEFYKPLANCPVRHCSAPVLLLGIWTTSQQPVPATLTKPIARAETIVQAAL